MIGAIAGDIIGSVYERRRNRIKTKKFPLFSLDCSFTDDTVLTVAVAAAILRHQDYTTTIREIGRKYPTAGYGSSFISWLFSDKPQPYNSWGNGSAMRVSPIGFAFEKEETVLSEAKRTAEITHNHPEGIKGAQATALGIFLARTNHDKEYIKKTIQDRFCYDLSRKLDEIRPSYRFDVSCQRTVPEAIITFLESTSFEDAIRNAISLGGDSDTLACIAGGIAHAYYGRIPPEIAKKVKELLTDELWQITKQFCRRYGIEITDIE